jgi:rhodanese-related sulfurtransferase
MLARAKTPARVKSVSATELQQMLRSGATVALLDVRTEEERRIATIPAARAFERLKDLDDLDPGAMLVVYCHHGVRSRAVAERLALEGFSDVYNLEGGIDAWASAIDQTMPRY